MDYKKLLKIAGKLPGEEAEQDFFTCHNPNLGNAARFIEFSDSCCNDCIKCGYQDSRLAGIQTAE